MRIQLLFLKTEALDFVKVLASLKWYHVVCADASDRLVCRVPRRVEC